MPGMPLAKGVGGLRSREFYFEGRVAQPERKAKIAQPDNSFLFFVFTIWLAEWVIFTVVFWDFYVPVALAIHSRMPVWNCSSIILSNWYLHVVARGNWSHSHSLRNNSQTYSSHENMFHGIPLRLTISWRWFQNYNLRNASLKTQCILQKNMTPENGVTSEGWIGFSTWNHPNQPRTNWIVGDDGVGLLGNITMIHSLRSIDRNCRYFGIDRYLRNPACNATIPFESRIYLGSLSTFGRPNTVSEPGKKSFSEDETDLDEAGCCKMMQANRKVQIIYRNILKMFPMIGMMYKWQRN